MGKRQNKRSIDLLSETQHNARWFYGRRSYTTLPDMTEAEWSQHRRNLLAVPRPAGIITTILCIALGIFFAAVCVSALRKTGFSSAVFVSGGFATMFWSIAIQDIKRLSRKD